MLINGMLQAVELAEWRTLWEANQDTAYRINADA